jgi:hypothetical protein
MTRGSATPAAITNAAPIHNPPNPKRLATPPTQMVESAAARPNIGQAQPKACGSGIAVFAISGRNVAGTM